MTDQFPLYLTVSAFLLYTALLFLTSYLTSRSAGNNSFFSAERKAPWPLVAYGMVGASISGVSFISVPGNVLLENFYYLPMVIGFTIGYIVVAHLLLPIYYKMGLTSIYSYLGERFGRATHRTGSLFFMVSRLLGSAVRVYIVIIVLFALLPQDLWEGTSADSGPLSRFLIFAFVAALFLLLLYLYTYKGGVKTIVWTDVIQTTFMLAALFMTIFSICRQMGWGVADMMKEVAFSKYVAVWDTDPGSSTHFVKQIIAGIFMTVTMTGLDQGMMQKNLACRDLGASRKNIYSTSAIIFVVNLFFLALGALFAIYVESRGGMETMGIETTDQVYPVIAGEYLGTGVGVLFLVGLISASYPSAGAALTSLTTSVCVDFFKFDSRDDMSDKKKEKLRMRTEAVVAFLFFIIILFLYAVNDDSVINLIYRLASYTYGPLLGIFALGIFTKVRVKDSLTPVIAILSPILCALADLLLDRYMGFSMGFALLLVNGTITFILMFLFGRRAS